MAFTVSVIKAFVLMKFARGYKKISLKFKAGKTKASFHTIYLHMGQEQRDRPDARTTIPSCKLSQYSVALEREEKIGGRMVQENRLIVHR